MILCYVLTMPGAPTWNGRTSYNENLYAKCRPVGRSDKARARAAEIIAEGPYRYHWNDGWCASVSVSEVSTADARRIAKRSCGFGGYEWMIDSIERDLKILAPHERKAATP